jgi:hypothetical protein
VISACLALACLVLPLAANAQSIIRQPSQHPRYYFEAEPHLAFGLLDPPGFGGGTGLGFGFRGTVQLLDQGFIPKLNDSVGIGFGLDYLRYDGWQGPRGVCAQFAPGPGGVPICVRTTALDHVNYFYVPVVMQWSFWLHRQWSVFGEPGAGLHFEDGQLEFDPFIFYAGGRFHLSERITLTLRIGYPTLTFGASFLL